MISRLLFAAGTAVFVGVGASSAATLVSFDLQGGQSTTYNSLPTAFSLVQGGITATFTARSFTSVAFSGGASGGVITSGTLANGSTPPHIGRYSQGVGVVNSPTDDSHTVDGNGYKDFVEIGFSEKVTLSSISFGYYGSGDDFRWMWDSTGDGKIGVGDFVSGSFPVGTNNPFAGFDGVQTSLFAVGAFNDTQICQKTEYQYQKINGNWVKVPVVKEYACKEEDSWKLKTVKVETIDPPPPVPLPAAGLLLLAALGGLTGLRRRA